MSKLINECLFPAYILRMLYEFYRQQNGKKPGSVHATYLISGCRRRQDPTFSRKGLIEDGEDEYMQSSPFRSSPVQQVDGVVEDSPLLSITLVKEEDLKGTFDDPMQSTLNSYFQRFSQVMNQLHQFIFIVLHLVP